jgi:hypothetical protein
MSTRAGNASSSRAPSPRWLAPALVAGSSVLVVFPGGLGALSLPSLAVLAAAVIASAGWLLLAAPQWLVVIIPAVLPAPMMMYTYLWELLLYGSVLLLVLWGVRQRAPWVSRLSALEVALVLFSAWALFSVFWSWDMRNYTIQARRICLGVVSLWAASRLPRMASRALFERGILFATLTLGCAALGKRLTTGFSESQAAIRRPEATNLGWGTANFIATLLLLLTPPMLALAMHRRGRLRLAAWSAVGLSALLQMIIASRAAAVLFVGGTIVQVLGASGRRARWTAVAVVGVLASLLASPLGQSFFLRFTSLRELGSMTVRIWFQREAWRRLIEHLPFGLGLGQGYSNPDKLQGVDPHNYWLLVGGDLGIPGLVLWAVVMVMVWRALSRMARSPGWQATANALRIGFVTAQIHTLVEPTFQGVQYQFVFFWLMGGTLAYHAAEMRREEPALQRAGEPALPEAAASSSR